MTSTPDVPTIVALRSRHVRDPAPAEEPATSNPARTTARTAPVARMALVRIMRDRLIAPSVRRLGASLTPEQGRREKSLPDSCWIRVRSREEARPMRYEIRLYPPEALGSAHRRA